MKKILSTSLTFLLLASVSSTAFAQPGVNLRAKAGYAAPVGDFGDAYKGAVAFGAALEVSIVPRLALEAAFLRHAHDDDLGLGVDLTLTDVTLNAKVYLATGSVRPFLTAGGGAYQWDAAGGESETDFGFNGGGGILIAIGGNVTLGVEGAYHTVSTGNGTFDNSIDFVNVVGTASIGF